MSILYDNMQCSKGALIKGNFYLLQRTPQYKFFEGQSGFRYQSDNIHKLGLNNKNYKAII